MTTEDRWDEIRFYSICMDILQLHNNIMDVLDFIDSLSFLNYYQPEQVKKIAQDCMNSFRFRPTKEEFCLICYDHEVPVRDITRRSGVHNNTLYRMIKTHKEDPRKFYARLLPNDLTHITAFLSCVDKIKGFGI